MPTYQYVCTECGGQIEAVQKFTDDPLTVHDACGGRLRKVFSPVGIVFKGSGFYRTDSRKGPAAAVNASSSDSSTSAGDKKPGDGDKKAGEKSSSPTSSDSSSSSSASSDSSGSAGKSSGEKVA